MTTRDTSSCSNCDELRQQLSEVVAARQAVQQELATTVPYDTYSRCFDRLTEQIKRAEAAESALAGVQQELQQAQLGMASQHSTLVSLLARAEEAEGQLQALQRDYHELILAVGNKYPGESRHETALRYIRRAEQPSGEAKANAAAPAPPGQE